MSRPIANARMYAVTPEVEAVWQALIERVAAAAGVAFDYVPYPAPLPLEELWQRPDLGCVFMCGFPIALKLADVEPLAAPIPDAPWAGGRARYRTDLVVRADRPWDSLEDVRGGTLGWTVEHSHSGFNALRHHLLRYRKPGQAQVFAAARGSLVTARRILDSVLDGSIDIGPLDAYWHALIRRHRPDLTANIRILESTDLAPMPAFVAHGATPPATLARLRGAFAAAHEMPEFGMLAAPLGLLGFESVSRDTYAETLAWARAAEAAGYPRPA